MRGSLLSPTCPCWPHSPASLAGLKFRFCWPLGAQDNWLKLTRVCLWPQRLQPGIYVVSSGWLQRRGPQVQRGTLCRWVSGLGNMGCGHMGWLPYQLSVQIFRLSWAWRERAIPIGSKTWAGLHTKTDDVVGFVQDQVFYRALLTDSATSCLADKESVPRGMPLPYGGDVCSYPTTHIALCPCCSQRLS